ASARAVDQRGSLLNSAPDSLEAHLQRIQQLAQSPFATAAEQESAAEINRLHLSLQSLLAGLLLPTAPQGVESLPASGVSSNNPAFKPAAFSEQEKALYLKLKDDTNIHDIYLYGLVSKLQNIQQTNFVFTQGVLETNRASTRLGKVYNPNLQPDLLRFRPTKYDSVDFPSGNIIAGGLLPEC